jgi:hypothetical protein
LEISIILRIFFNAKKILASITTTIKIGQNLNKPGELKARYQAGRKLRTSHLFQTTGK